MHSHNDTLIPGSSVDGGLNGRFSASILFIDISGFTPLTESLFQHGHQGAEILSALLSDVFGEMVCQVYARQGFITMFAGDGFFAVFPGDSAETADRAWETAVSIQKHFRSARGAFSIYVTPYGQFEMGVKIGMSVGEIEWGILYSDNQAICYFRGEAMYNCADAQQTAVTGEIIAHNSLLGHLSIPHEAWSADVPAFHKITPLQAVSSPPNEMPQLALPPVLSAVIRNQAYSEPASPNFRQICPVFVSFQADHPEWPTLVKQAMRLAPQYGGTFNRLEFGDKGDMMLLWFGAPVSYENNAERAVKFLLALERETAVPWRAGLAYGLVWAGKRGGAAYSEYGCVGDVLNTAARIVAQVQWGQIWLDDSVAQELPISYSLQALGAFKFKGKQSAKPLFRLTGVTAEAHILPINSLVGRKQELSQCHEALAPIFNGRFAGLITIQGEAGIGKSRFAALLRQQLAEQVTWLTCPADDILSESLNPFQIMLASWCRQSPEQETSENWKQFIDEFRQLTTRLNRVKDARATAVYDELHRTQTTLANMAGIFFGNGREFLPPELRFTNNLLGLTAFLQAQALLKPVVLHVEDAHWLDEESWQYLVDVPRRLAGFPLVLLMTGRPDGPFVKPLKPETAVFHTRIALQPFTETETQEMCRLLLGKPVTETVLSYLQVQSQGNPFFVEQLIFELGQQGSFTLEQIEDQELFTLAGANQQILPQTLSLLLTSRLDRLPDPVKTVVQMAAVLGQRFTVSLLTAMCAEDVDLLSKIQEATKQKIWQAQTENALQFQHALLREVAYAMQPQSQRCGIHFQAAAALERLYADDLPAFYREIAHHYHAAYENGMLSARKPARHYLRLAGEQAARMYENETAVSYLTTALALSNREKRQFPLLLVREAVYHLQGQRELQAQDIALLTRIAQAQQDNGMMAAAALRLARYQEALGEYEQSIASAQAAHAYASSPVQVAEACLQWGLALMPTGAYREASEQLQAALFKAKQAEQYELQSQALVNLGKVALLQSDYQDAVRRYHHVLVICQASGDKQMQATVLNELAEVSRFQNDFETAVSHLTTALAITREIGDRRTESRALKKLGSIAASRYQFVEARENFARDLQISREIGDLDGEGQALGNLGYVAVILGNYAQAEDYIQQALAIVRLTGNRHSEAVALGLLGWCANAQTKWADAVIHFEQGKKISTEIGDYEMEMYHVSGLGNAFTGLQRAQEGAHLLRQAAVGYRLLQMEAFALESMAGWVRAQLVLGNARQTMPVLEELLNYLKNIGLFHGANTPLLMLWTCYQVLLALGDDRAGVVLAKAVELLETAVSHIPDETSRHTFIQNAYWRREIMLAASERMFYN
ncbi:MAG: tetratricopeptide repeat protein [Anaerolineae bacterium]|nr:tetratricopeptide repeat protein [Anaerolineae bacterium]